MGHISFTAHFDAPIEKVFAIGVDPARVPEYMPWISDIHDILGDGDTVGSSFSFRDHQLLGQHHDGTSEVVEVEPPFSQTTVTTYDNGVSARWAIRLTRAGDGTDAMNEVDYEVPAGVFNAIGDRFFLHGLIEDRLRRSAETFKALVEEVRAPAAV
jgi:uncharacterized protein YndB with AHSA1/START domain